MTTDGHARMLTVVTCFSRCFFLVTLIGTTVLSWSVTVPTSITVVEFDVVNVTCSTNFTSSGSDNSVDFEWTRPSKPNFRQDGAVLFFESAIAVDVSGNYTCTVLFGQELIGVATLRVIVQYAPRWDNAVVKKSGNDVGSAGTLTCVVHAEPLPVQFYWTTPMGISFDASKTSEGYSVTSSYSSSVLTVTRLQESDYGNYFCNASNVRGTHSFELTLQRPGQPDSPQECIQSAKKAGDSVTVECTAGYDGGRSVEYVVYTIHSGSAIFVSCNNDTSAGKIDALKIKSLSANKFQLTVGNLEPLRKYDLHIYARNSYGCSSDSLSVSVETTALQSSSVSTGIIAVAITLLIVLLITVFAIKKCRQRLRNQQNFLFFRRRNYYDRARSSQNLITNDDVDVDTALERQ